jgi:hypothetical protein
MRTATRVRYNGPEATLKLRKTARNRERLIANDMRSRANANALQCAPSIFLIGNEFSCSARAGRTPTLRKRRSGWGTRHNNPKRPGTHFPREMAARHHSFLIHNPELETNLTCTKQTAGHVSNRQFLAFFKITGHCERRAEACKGDRDARFARAALPASGQAG